MMRFTPIVRRCVAAPRMQQLAAMSASVSRMTIAPRAFSASALASSHGKVDRDLSHKLREELKFEESDAGKTTPEFLEEFKEKNIFKIEDKIGEKEISLVRTFGNEKITAIFSTDALSESYEMEEEDMDDDSKFPINVTILIEKKAGAEDTGAMEISAIAQDKAFMVESVTFCKSSSLINDQTAEGDWQRRGRYGGPVFTDLDDDLQDLFHNFLKERGFDEELAAFIPEYIVHKEQSEYTEWLRRVSEWVEK
ncbi:Mitochondrial acidic protein mam33 [Dinochytrium kinnereticum]|nr:Mitochondrial acidic protein mam33 [Dinochytrium kinnereticum]